MTATEGEMVIAIDGPAASGKTTIGHMLAEHLNFLLLDTGCMYRVVTLAALKRHIDVNDEPRVTRLAEVLQIDINPIAGKEDGRLYTVLLENQDVTWELRSAHVDSSVSQVSAYKGVREELVRRQRQIAARGRVVMVGRDIGTVVVPDAPLKLYIIASAEERARRRWNEREEREGSASFEQILADMQLRDRFDGQRQFSPLRPAKDAIIVDTTDRTPAEILSEILSLLPFKHDLLH